MNYSELPLTRYAMSGDVSVAYQTMGDGPINIIAIPGIVSHVEFLHEMPGYTAFLQRLSKFARVITFDKRGQGLSDRISGAPTLEERMDDVRAGGRRAHLAGALCNPWPPGPRRSAGNRVRALGTAASGRGILAGSGCGSARHQQAHAGAPDGERVGQIAARIPPGSADRARRAPARDQPGQRRSDRRRSRLCRRCDVACAAAPEARPRRARNPPQPPRPAPPGST